MKDMIMKFMTIRVNNSYMKWLKIDSSEIKKFDTSDYEIIRTRECQVCESFDLILDKSKLSKDILETLSKSKKIYEVVEHYSNGAIIHYLIGKRCTQTFNFKNSARITVKFKNNCNCCNKVLNSMNDVFTFNIENKKYTYFCSQECFNRYKEIL